MDNAETEYAFIDTFFGQHSNLSVPTPRPESPTLFSPASSEARARDDPDGESVGSEADKGTSLTGSMISKEERGEKLRRTVIEALWKSVMEPAQEYARVRLISPIPAKLSVADPSVFRTSPRVSLSQPHPRHLSPSSP